jgi:hypothetical protein
MTQVALDHSFGQQLVRGIAIQRRRPLWPGALMRVRVGDTVAADTVLAEVADTDGELRKLMAGMAGTVTQVVEGEYVVIDGVATILDGLVGVGGPVAAPLVTLQRGDAIAVTPIQPGSIVLFPQSAPLTLLQRAASGGALAIIAASAQAHDFEAFVRMDVGAMLDGTVPEPRRLPLTILLTEGFGTMPMRQSVIRVLSQYLNTVVLACGTTNLRKNVRPEVVLPAPSGARAELAPAIASYTQGAKVAVMAGRFRGQEGEIARVYERPQRVEPGFFVPCAGVRLEDGSTVVMPLHALDRIG